MYLVAIGYQDPCRRCPMEFIVGATTMVLYRSAVYNKYNSYFCGVLSSGEGVWSM